MFTKTKTVSPTFKISKSHQLILLKHRLLAHYFFMPEGDLVPMTRLISEQGLQRPGRRQSLTTMAGSPAWAPGTPLSTSPNPSVHPSSNFPQHCPHSTFFKIPFLRVTVFYSMVGTELSVRHYWHPVPGVMLPTQLRGKGGRTRWESRPSKRMRGSLGRFSCHICLPLLLFLFQELNQNAWSIAMRRHVDRNTYPSPIPPPTPTLVVGKCVGQDLRKRTRPCCSHWLSLVHTEHSVNITQTRWQSFTVAWSE